MKKHHENTIKLLDIINDSNFSILEKPKLVYPNILNYFFYKFIITFNFCKNSHDIFSCYDIYSLENTLYII